MMSKWKSTAAGRLGLTALIAFLLRTGIPLLSTVHGTRTASRIVHDQTGLAVD
jgi:hypothetical protein